MKFTYELNEKEIPFLDLKMKLNEGKISADLYIKSTDRHQYLNFISSHLNHTKKSIVYSQGLRDKRICSEIENFLKHMREMKLWFLKQGYPENKVDQELGKVDCSESSRRTNKKDKSEFLVATYHPLLQNIGRFFIDLLIYFILIKKLKEFLHLVPWLHFVVHGTLAAISLWLNCIL